jgi:succinate dehydrogenase / fumarate reductase, cytochrome b subunit
MKTSIERVNNRENREGIKAWLNPSRFGWERISYWLQRQNGVFIVVYFIGHVYETGSLLRGENSWNAMMEITQTPGGYIFLVLVIGTSTFPSTNGIRVIFTHGGKGLGNSGRPDYRYGTICLNCGQRSEIWIALILAAIVMLYGSTGTHRWKIRQR